MRLKSQKSAGHLRVALDDRQRDLRGQQAFFNELLRESLTSQQERARRMVSGLVGGKACTSTKTAGSVQRTPMWTSLNPRWARVGELPQS